MKNFIIKLEANGRIITTREQAYTLKEAIAKAAARAGI